ncbi:hypothetical protein [Pleionea sp. CnH1-48]|uniref:hypothetical protein n=1 Tax=Pleionea sp. CnH1-48 TaxID=2954494 RepID=UPI00209815CC|nr:hypothetical protein [Pleionea sp. CnH1-48]MCO7225741.1 hypothetical protein [Pleionea sp. CnH1-48]
MKLTMLIGRIKVYRILLGSFLLFCSYIEAIEFSHEVEKIKFKGFSICPLSLPSKSELIDEGESIVSVLQVKCNGGLLSLRERSEQDGLFIEKEFVYAHPLIVLTKGFKQVGKLHTLMMSSRLTYISVKSCGGGCYDIYEQWDHSQNSNGRRSGYKFEVKRKISLVEKEGNILVKEYSSHLDTTFNSQYDTNKGWYSEKEVNLGNKKYFWQKK